MRRLIALLLYLSLVVASRWASADDNAIVDRVLATPSENEVFKVLQSLRQMDLKARNIRVHYALKLTNGNTLQVLSHSGECGIHFGVVIFREIRPTRATPVVIFAAGGDGVHTELDIASDFEHRAVQFPAFLGEPLDEEFLVVIPSFRGQTLVVGNKRFRSAGDARDAFKGAATDTLSLLNAVLREYDFADEGSIGIYGGSRGGAVALLAAARDERIKRVVTVATPTDMQKLYRLYPAQFNMLFFDDLFSGRITETVARSAFIACSPVHFVDYLPRLQMHHDKNDPFVPADFAGRLVSAVESNDAGVDIYYYDEGEHGFPSDPDYWTRVQSFIRPLSGR